MKDIKDFEMWQSGSQKKTGGVLRKFLTEESLTEELYREKERVREPARDGEAPRDWQS